MKPLDNFLIFTGWNFGNLPPEILKYSLNIFCKMLVFNSL